MSIPSLKTTRLLLRPFTSDDAPKVQQLAATFEVADTSLNIPHPYPDGAASQWISTHQELFESGRGVNWGIVIRSTDELCGSISLDISQPHQRAEIGYWLGVSFWKRGYMTEAVASVLAYGFTDLGLHRMYASHFARNPASGRVMQKLGMKHEGTYREHFRKWQQFEDSVLYGILQSEWQVQH